MKLRYQGIILALVCAGMPACEREQRLGPPKAVPVREDGAIDLKLMTFNIRYESPHDHGDRSWSNRIPQVVGMIRREAPDVIGVQEALHGQAADLWASLPDYEFFGIGRDDGLREGEYSGIFYRRDRFRPDVDDRGTFWLSDTPGVPGSRTWGNEIPRVAAWVRLVDLATSRGFYVFNTHWDHQNQPSREKAALLIADRIAARAEPDEPVALIGDFNATETNPAFVYLTGAPAVVAGSREDWDKGLVDAYQKLHGSEKNRRTLHFWRANRDGMAKVDHILVSRDGQIRDAEIVASDQPPVSDHFPVTARVVFPSAD